MSSENAEPIIYAKEIKNWSVSKSRQTNVITNKSKNVTI
ncbi:hypothetical protein T190130A13A_10784 [Tenacibaculum sp. 190130A14a]|uniref:Uncharacterized protein n=1 Tax=Tenacibaculum polynesiense TaxID=3137857 RepID=A0ABM9P7V9_9FLAO